MEELRSRQEAERKKQEEGHNQKIDSIRQQYEMSIQGVLKGKNCQNHFSDTHLTYVHWINKSSCTFQSKCCVCSELKTTQQTDLENLEKTLKETEATLSVRNSLFGTGPV